MKNPAITALVPLGAAALLLAGCTGGESTADPTEDSAGGDETLRINWGAFPETWTPGFEFEGGVMRIVYETLVGRDDAGNLAPALAESWEFNEDSTELTLMLREGVTFHDGSDFTSEVVKANLELVAETPGPYGTQLNPITSIDTPDDLTVVLTFAGPTPSMPTTLSTRVAPMASLASIEDGSSATTPIGTAPWAYDESGSTTGTVMSFTTFEDYWGEAPGFPNVELYAIPDDEAAAAAMVNGEIDLTDTDPSVESRFDGSDIETFFIPVVRNNVMFFDRGPGGLFEDVEVRQAICYAIDGEQWAAVDPTYTPQTQHFLEGTQGYNNEIEGYFGTMDDANPLWASAGSPTIEGEALAAPFTADQLSVYMDTASRLDGFNISVLTVPPPEWAQGWNSGQYPIGMGSNDELTPFEWYQAWFAADAGGNPSGTESAELKAAADAAIAAGTTAEADELWADVTKIVADEALSCAHGLGEQQIAYNPTTVDGAQESNYPFEINSVNLRTLSPAS